MSARHLARSAGGWRGKLATPPSRFGREAEHFSVSCTAGGRFMKPPVALSAAVLALILGASTAAQAQSPNTLTDAEKTAGWTLLFNGKDFDGWRKCNGTEMPANWVIEDQAMKVFTADGRKPGQGAGGDILYGVKKFRNFELSIDWKTEKAGNSGIFYNVREMREAHLLRRARGAGARQRRRHGQQGGEPPGRLALRHARGGPQNREARGRVEHHRHPGAGWQGDAHPERREGGRVRSGRPNGTRWSRTASSRPSPASPRASRRKAISASRTTATRSGSGTSRFGNSRRGHMPTTAPSRRRRATATTG